jgi:hypothetical protein
MFTCRTNTDTINLIHEATCTTDGLLLDSLGLNPNTLPRGESSRRPFLLPIASANRCAITRISANRETLYTDECFMNHGTAALCKRLLETGKWLTLAVGSRYERLIIELHRLADNSTGRYGYNLRLTRG